MLNCFVGCGCWKEVVNGYFFVLVFLICDKNPRVCISLIYGCVMGRFSFDSPLILYHPLENQRLKEDEERTLTVFKETADLSQTMRRKLLDVIVMAILWIVSAHSNDLVVFLTLLKA